MLKPLAVLAAAPLLFAQSYTLGPDSQRQPGVPAGTVTQHTWTSKIFPGTVRDYWIYVPAQYQASSPAALMVFQDGGGFASDQGRWRVPIVFDNLIHKRQMPVTLAVMINPGVVPASGPDREARYNRSFEYDALGDRYTRFLLEEILPEVAKRYSISANPNDRAIAGSSSGAICAFTVAWNRPDAFRRVLSFVGSYTNLRGGEIYSSLIRKTEPKPLRVFLQDGERDNNLYAGSWYIANQDMASALEYAGYETKFVVGTEGHNNIHGSAILPDALRWLWAGHPTPVGRLDKTVDRHFVKEILMPGKGWELVSQGHIFTEGPAIDRQGNIFFTDIPNNRIHKISTDGKVTLFKSDTGAANGLQFGPDGRLYACQNARKRIVAYSMDGAEHVVTEGVESNDLAITSGGAIYFTDPINHRVWYLDPKGVRRLAHEGIERPNGIQLSPDQSLLNVADSRGRWVWSFQIQPDGSLAHGQPFHRLEIADDSSSTSADGMTIDRDGYLYVTTRIGLQVCDPPGRVVAIIDKPQPGSLANVVFAGPDLDWLYVTAGDKVFRRQVRRKGVLPWSPLKPPKPQL